MTNFHNINNEKKNKIKQSITFRVLNNQNQPTQTIDNAVKLQSIEGIHSLLCRARKSINSIMQFLSWILFGKLNMYN